MCPTGCTFAVRNYLSDTHRTRYYTGFLLGRTLNICYDGVTMISQSTSFGFIVRIEAGEEILNTLESFCNTNAITGGVFMGIGAVRNATIGMYHMDIKEYRFRTFNEPHEITNLTGNVAMHNDELMIHAHITLGSADQTAIGGHLQQAETDPTCEITFFSGTVLTRAHDDYSDLPLLDLS